MGRRPRRALPLGHLTALSSLAVSPAARCRPNLCIDDQSRLSLPTAVTAGVCTEL